MRRFLTAVLISAAVASYSLAAAKYEIKFATVAPDGSTWMNEMQNLNDEIMEKTNGDVKFKFYPGGIMGDEKDVLRKMKVNQVQAAGFTSQGLGEVVPEVRILNLPLLFKSYKDIDNVMLEMSPAIEAMFLKKGFVVLGWPEVGFVYVFTKNRVEAISDLQKTKMWIWGDDTLVGTLFKNLKIVPIPLSLTDVMQSLQTGMIEGVYCSPLSCIAMQWNTKVKYMLAIKIANVPGGVLINKKSWDLIPDNYKVIVRAACKKYFDKLTQASRKENEDALSVLKKQGVTFTDIKAPADLKTFDDVSMKTSNDLIGKYYDKPMLESMLKILAGAGKEKN
ncbi:MAG: TRAP transporter substrate-binding protein DctP [Candidatus Goldiibacteriota bacterium]|jgi:TRAP-type C4-dicarboxylate transport system substrate-binding protein